MRPQIVSTSGAPIAGLQERRIVVEFQEDGSVRMEVGPGLDYGQLIVAAALVTRRANQLVDQAEDAQRATMAEAAAVAAGLQAERAGRPS